MAKIIMFVDDDEDDIALFNEAVSEVDASINCITASSAAVALEKLAKAGQERPNIIFLDINMPIMNGWDCLTLLKDNLDYSSVPVMMYSTSSNPRDMEEAQRLGAHGFIIKPSNFEILKQRLIEALDHLPNVNNTKSANVI